MVPTGSRQKPDGPRLIYVTRFASHRHGTWQLRGLRGFGHRGPGLGAHCALKQAAEEPGPPGGERPTGSQAGVTDTPDSASFQRRSRAPRGRKQAARAGGRDRPVSRLLLAAQLRRHLVRAFVATFVSVFVSIFAVRPVFLSALVSFSSQPSLSALQSVGSQAPPSCQSVLKP